MGGAFLSCGERVLIECSASVYSKGVLTTFLARLRFRARYYAVPLAVLGAALIVWAGLHQRPYTIDGGVPALALSRDVPRGHVITAADVHQTWLPPGAAPADVTKDAVGLSARVALSAGTPLTTSVLATSTIQGHVVTLDVRGSALPPLQAGDALTVVVTDQATSATAGDSGTRVNVSEAHGATAHRATYQVTFVRQISASGATVDTSGAGSDAASTVVVAAEKPAAVALSSLPTTARLGFIAEQ